MERDGNKAGEGLSILLNTNDNVVTLKTDLAAGATIEAKGQQVTLVDSVDKGHKVAIQDIAEGDPILKYNQIIGFAGAAIAPGAHVHSHNVTFKTFDRDHAIGSECRDTDFIAESDRAVFDGYLRADGRAATRNTIAVLATVNCANPVVKKISDSFKAKLDDYPNVDDVVAYTHEQGCWPGEYLQRVLAGYANNPNVAGYLLVGLGCEGNHPDVLAEAQDLSPNSTMARSLVIQDNGGTMGTVEKGVAYVAEMLAEANRTARQPLPASKLILGLECGGSDAYSGITANPALGAAVDLLVRHGGTAVLAETPEIYGAEHLLTRRAVSQEVGDKLLGRIEWWEGFTGKHGISVNNNPTPGNKKGGLTTILEKSLGAAAKGGTTNLVDVYDYARPITAQGFTFMDTPGYDPISVTGMVAGGANILCFTTGRGSILGCKPSPMLKLATNSAMYQRMEGDMDVNCGTIVDGDETVEQVGARIFQLILDTASGKPSKSEVFDCGEYGFAPWHIDGML